jgi:hypothetical protein
MPSTGAIEQVGRLQFIASDDAAASLGSRRSDRPLKRSVFAGQFFCASQ